jgi:hypothetical protein
MTDYVTGLAPSGSNVVTNNFSSGMYLQAANIYNTSNTFWGNNIHYNLTTPIPVPFSISFWFRMNTNWVTSGNPTGGLVAVIRCLNAFIVKVSLDSAAATRIQFSINDSASNTRTTYSIPAGLGVWTFVAASVTSTGATCYAQNVASSSMTTVILSPSTGVTFDKSISTVGNQYGDASGGVVQSSLPFNGLIDDLRVFNTALSAAQVQSIYNAQGMPSRGVQVNTIGSTKTTLIGTPLFSQLSATAVSSAVGAFSLRAVNGLSPSGTAKAVQIKRNSDLATQDFYADRLGNLLTVPVTGQTLANWLGGSTGNVVTWYDQSGRGNHATQATAANQPVIKRATKGPGYMVNFNGTSQFVTLSVNYDFLNGTNITVNAVALRSSTKTSQNWVFGTNTPSVNYQRFQIGFGSDTSMLMNTTSAAPSITIPAYNASNEPVYYMTGGLIPSRVFYQNDVLGGTNINTGLMAVPSGYSYSIGNGVQGGVYYYQGNLFELLIFTSALDQTQVTTLYQNQLSYTGT